MLGGDCTITLGVISGLLRGMPDDLGLWYLDGDIDLNTPATTHSGILDAMGIAQSFANTEKPNSPECGARNRPERRQPSWLTKQ